MRRDPTAHPYCLPVRVERSPGSARSRYAGQTRRRRQAKSGRGVPASFVWHGATYEVAEVLSTWHLMDRWWRKGVESAYAGNGGYSNRYYFRVRCPDHQVLDLYYWSVHSDPDGRGCAGSVGQKKVPDANR